MDTQEPFWRVLFEHPLHPNDRTFHPVGSTKWELLDPISSDEVAKALSRIKDGVPGPDGCKLKDARALPPDQLAAHFNLWLLTGYLASTLRQGETVLLPKKEGTGAPEKFRPIMISDIVVKCFHRILAQRMQVNLPFSSCQKAFRQWDGLAERIIYPRGHPSTSG